MNVQPITMDPGTAREKLRAVRAALHRRADGEYQALERAYAALAEGTPILSLPEAFRTAGIDEQGRPRLAIARADRRRCRFSWRAPNVGGLPRTEGALYFDTRADPWSLRGTGVNLVLAVVLGREFAPPTAVRMNAGGEALVPLIPPEVRNQVRFRDRDCYLLWEVETWTPVPDRDPMLLRHLGGDAYAVLAHWDLTDLERMVMAGRREA